MSLIIHPLHVGTITRQLTTFCYGLQPGEKIDVPLISWYIEGGKKKILVDTGGGDPSEVNPRCLPYSREKEQAIEYALARLGIKCDEIDIVIVTHLHWDHCSGNILFSKSKLIVQKEELKIAREPFPINKGGYLKKIIEEVDYTVISGDKEIADGVKVILTPGHTYGLQGVLVDGETKRYFIAGDTIAMFKNLETDPPLISGVYVDLKSYYNSLKKIAKMSAFILPSHDFKVFDRDVYR